MLGPDAPDGACPVCALRIALGVPGASLPAVVTEKAGDRIGHYRLLEQIGEGGCGVVYMAEQTEPIRRRVAFKVIKLGMDTKSVVARFEAERQALALMDHPNIAKVLDAGATDTGRPYFVMELVKGIKITDYCDQNHLSTQERLHLFMQVCHAVQHAHQKGVIHRDLKPSNILVTLHDGVPVPKVIDFGIAKATQQPLTDKTLFTAFQQFIGTPAYMSPEQAELSGLDIDTRSDIYSLGVLLYELLTGCLPFEQSDLLRAGFDEMRRIIRETEPPKPSTKLGTSKAETGKRKAEMDRDLRRLLQEVRGDLDWIVMKCLEKDRQRRYESANGLAHDIERHLNHEPVTAAAPNRLYTFQKLVRRHRTLFTSVGAVVLALVLGLSLATWRFIEEQRARHLLEARAYAADMVLASRTVNSGVGLGNVTHLVSYWQDRRADLRGWEWHYLNGLCHQEIATLGDPAHRVTTAEWSPDGRQLAVGTAAEGVQIWDGDGHKPALRLPSPVGGANSISWNPDGSQIASAGADGVITIWSVKQQSEVARLHGHRNEVGRVAWSPDSRKLVSAGADRTVRVWEPSDRAEIQRIPTPSLPRSVGWNNDGTKVVVGMADGRVKVFESVSGQEVLDLGPNTGIGWRAAVAWSPDGKWLATGGDDHGVRIWDATTGKLVRSLWGHASGIMSLAWSPDCEWLASATSGDGKIRVWDVKTGGIKRSFAGQLGGIRCLAWHPDGAWLASTGLDGTLKIWDATRDNTAMRVLRQPDQAVCVAWHPGGKKLAVGTQKSSAWIWDLTGTNAPLSLGNPTNWTWAVAWNPAGTRLATGGGDRDLRLWDAATTAEVWRTVDSAGEIRSLAWNPQGNLIAAVGGGPSVRIWDATTGDLVAKHALDGRGALSVAWCPAGKRLATGGAGINILDPISGKPHRVIRSHAEALRFVAWSPDGLKLAAAGDDGIVTVWDANSGTPIHTLLGHGASAYAAAWSPDGRRLATASWDRTVKIWHALSGTEVCVLGGYSSGVSVVAWSPDGLQLASVDKDGNIFLHNAAPGQLRQPGIAIPQATETIQRVSGQIGEPGKWYHQAAERYTADGNADALNRLAWMLATSPHTDLRDGPGAVVVAGRAVAFTGRKDPNILDTLAAACAEAGQFEQAVRIQQEAIALFQDETRRREFGTRLRLYQANTPYHENE
jgi:WD40 repeat protein/serine/threonine protein kinase